MISGYAKGYVDELPTGRLYDGATLGMVLHFVTDDGGKLRVLRAVASHLKAGAPLVLVDACGDLTTPELLEAWRHQQNLAGLTWEQVEKWHERTDAEHSLCIW